MKSGCRGDTAVEEDSRRRWCLQQETETETGMGWCAKDDAHRRSTMTRTGQTCPTGGAPDPLDLAVAQEMQERLQPDEVI